MSTQAPFQLYYWPTPNGKKITIALEELDLPYEVHPVNIGVGDQFKPDFLKISPNNKMPALIDPEGPGGAPISIFESGAILQYLGRKTGRLYPQEERARVDVEQWLFWQVGGLGPMAGQTHHFRNYAPKLVSDDAEIAYGRERYINETNRLYGVLDVRLSDGRDYVAGAFSIADIAIWPWVLPEKQGQTIADFPHLAAWVERVGERPAVRRGNAVKVAKSLDIAGSDQTSKLARDVLFGQRARPKVEKAD